MWKKYKNITINEMRPYVVGEDMTNIVQFGTPKEGGMVVRSLENPDKMWYLPEKDFLKNYEEV